MISGFIDRHATEIYLQTLSLLQQASIISFDFETTGLDFLIDDIVGISLATDNDVCVYIPFLHNGIKTFDQVAVMANLKEIFERDDVILIAHNIKFDIQFLWNYNIDISHKFKNYTVVDTMLMSWLLNENRDNHKLKFLARDILKVDTITFEDLTKGQKFHTIDINSAVKYAMLDAKAPLMLYKIFKAQMEKEKLMDVFWRVEMRYARVLAKMERRGVDIDIELLNRYEERIDGELGELMTKLFLLAGREFNINSGDQLAEVLFSKLRGFGAPIIAMTDGGKKPRKDGTFAPRKPKTDADVIDTLVLATGQPWVPFCETLKRYKELKKIDSTYIKGLRNLIRSDGKLHCSFNHTGTVTGRISASEPNLQNQPANPTWVDKYYVGKSYSVKELWLGNDITIDDLTIPEDIKLMQKLFRCHYVKSGEDDTGRYFEVQRKIRDIYYNPNGSLVVSDYSQMEMRVMAHFSQDKHLMQAFIEGKVDIHTWVASKAFRVPIEEVSKDMRKKAKAVGFGTIFGKTVAGFAIDWYSKENDFWTTNLKSGRAEPAQKYLNKAQKFLDDFFAAFDGLAGYIEHVHNFCYKYGYIKTMTGRKRRLPGIYSTKYFEVSRAKRQAVNSKIQGSAGDFIKIAQINIEDRLEEHPEFQATQILQVHDELVIKVDAPEYAADVLNLVKETMETAVKLSVPIIAEAACAYRWGHAK